MLSPVADLFINGLSVSGLWDLFWPGVAGVGLLLVGAVAVVGYLRQWITSDWTPHWSRGVGGLALMTASIPAFLMVAQRIENKAAEQGVPVLTLLLAIAAQLGLFDEEGVRRRRRR